LSTDSQTEAVPLAYAASTETTNAVPFFRGLGWVMAWYGLWGLFSSALNFVAILGAAGQGGAAVQWSRAALVVGTLEFILLFGAGVLIVRRHRLALRWLNVAAALLASNMVLIPIYLLKSGMLVAALAQPANKSFHVLYFVGGLFTSSTASVTSMATCFLLARSRLLRNYLRAP
jgi:hypothetical protein